MSYEDAFDFHLKHNNALRVAVGKRSEATLKQVDLMLDHLLAKKVELMDEEQLRVALGEDVYEDDTAIAFKKEFPNGPTKYSYIAYKIRGQWYLSGTTGAKMTWEQVKDFMVKGGTEFWIATEWKPLLDEDA